ncbi:MAG TPA: hypothetical protein VNQ80_15405 [Parapedobacter sp.]|uniref:hypothetical protein n=1 Tax=Parapedobacter sp. TaxID=1958893 RepID=UPI002B9EC836|nr:hypothetical protein [Parapedobacter sp.]HWK58729.1 hypothetical protein [Parapedobacter sp.]
MFNFYFDSSSSELLLQLITTIASFLTMVIAAIALFAWKQQKKYDLVIDAKAKAGSVIEYIAFIRGPFNNYHLVELESFFQKAIDEKNNGQKNTLNYVIKNYKRFDNFYIEIVDISERLKSSFGKKNPLVKFYSFAVTAGKNIEQLKSIRESYFEFSAESGHSEQTIKEVVSGLDAQIFATPNEPDDINDNLRELFSHVENFRLKWYHI